MSIEQAAPCYGRVSYLNVLIKLAADKFSFHLGEGVSVQFVLFLQPFVFNGKLNIGGMNCFVKHR
jgi:hypothetical protein